MAYVYWTHRSLGIEEKAASGTSSSRKYCFYAFLVGGHPDGGKSAQSQGAQLASGNGLTYF